MATSEMNSVYRKRYYYKDHEKSKAYQRAWAKKWRIKNPELQKEILKRAYYKDVEKSRLLARESRERAKLDPERIERIRKYAREKMRRLKATDESHTVKKRLRTRICMALKRQRAGNKSASTITLVGCSIAELKKHIEALWKPGMTWENYGRKGWHIDHIRPCSDFVLIVPQEQRICFHFTNLQPLWWHENLSKGCKT